MIQHVSLVGSHQSENVLRFRFTGGPVSEPAPYTRALSVTIDPTVPQSYRPNKQSDVDTVYLRPQKAMAALFDKARGVGAYLARFVQTLMEQVKGPVTDGEGNHYSPVTVAEGASSSDTRKALLQAFQTTLGKLRPSVKEARVSLPVLESPADKARLVRDMAEQWALGAYNAYRYKQNPAPPNQWQRLSVGFTPTSELEHAASEGSKIGQAMNFTRALVDAPPNVKSPWWLGEQAKSLTSPTMQVDVKDKSWIEQQGMGMFLAVAAGNQNTVADSPRLVEMVYTPKDGQYDKTIMLVGKGIVFDTGGTNLKTGADPKSGKGYIHGMHGDMAGAAAVLGAMKLIDELQLPGVRVVALAPFTPNRIGENATLPFSYVLARNGKKVEASNTDAEGRLILGDAIHYGGEKYTPDLIVDIATLTGGKVRGLGDVNAVAIMGNDLKLSQRVEQIAKDDLGRKTATLELTDAHKNWVTRGGKGKADVYNSVDGRKDAKLWDVYGKDVDFDPENKSHLLQHSAQGGAFIKEFLPNPTTPWVHLDMAGAEFERRDDRGGDDMATGFGVKDLYAIVKAATEGDLLKKA